MMQAYTEEQRKALIGRLNQIAEKLKWHNAAYAQDVLLAVDALNANASQPVPDGFVMVPRALTAENGAKAALLGEFNLEYNLVCHECFGEGCDDCSGEGSWTNSIPVDWTTIKEIWAKGVEHFQAAAPEVE